MLYGRANKISLDRKSLFAVNCSHLHDNIEQNVCEAISPATCSFVVSSSSSALRLTTARFITIRIETFSFPWDNFLLPNTYLV